MRVFVASTNRIWRIELSRFSSTYAALHVFMICLCNEKDLPKIILMFLSYLLNSVGMPFIYKDEGMIHICPLCGYHNTYVVKWSLCLYINTHIALYEDNTTVMHKTVWHWNIGFQNECKPLTVTLVIWCKTSVPLQCNGIINWSLQQIPSYTCDCL